MSSGIRTYPAEVAKRREIARQAADVYKRLPQVLAIFSWGGTALGDADAGSDVDLGIYARSPIPTDQERKDTLKKLADDPDAVSFGKFADLEGCESFSVRGIHVFAGWWDFESEKKGLQQRLNALLDRLDDAKAENELGEMQRLLVLYDPGQRIAELQACISAWFTTNSKDELISERLNRAEHNLSHDFPRALDKNDLVWAEDCRHSVVNELIRVVYYKNDRFLRRLKGVDLELEQFSRKPDAFVQTIREIAAADPGQALPRLRELVQDVKDC